MPVWAILLVSCGGCGCLALVAFIGLATYIGIGMSRVMTDVFQEIRKAGQDLKVQEHHLATYQGHRYIVGTLKNVSTTNRYSWASIDFPLLDKAGAQIGTAIASTEDEIKPGGVWRFKAAVEEAAAVRYQPGEVLGSKVSPEMENLDPETKARLEEIKRRTKERIDEIVKRAKEDAKSKQGE